MGGLDSSVQVKPVENRQERDALFRTLSIIKSVSPLVGVEPNDTQRACDLVDRAIEDAKIIVSLIDPVGKQPWALSYAQQMAAEAIAAEEELSLLVKTQSEGRRPPSESGVEPPRIYPVDRRKYWAAIIEASQGGDGGPRHAEKEQIDDDLAMTLATLKGVSGLYTMVHRPWRFWQEDKITSERALADLSMRLRAVGEQHAEPLMSPGLSEHSRRVAVTASVNTAFTMGQQIYRQMAHQALAEFRAASEDRDKATVATKYRHMHIHEVIAEEATRRILMTYAMVPEVNDKIMNSQSMPAPR